MSRAFTGWTNAGSSTPWFPDIVNRMFPQTLVSAILGVRESRAGQPLYEVVVTERSATAARPGWLAGLKNWIDASNLAPSIRSAADQNRHAAMKNFGFGYRTHT
jgi:hypothetical protein